MKKRLEDLLEDKIAEHSLDQESWVISFNPTLSPKTIALLRRVREGYKRLSFY